MRTVAVVASLALVLTGCGSGGQDDLRAAVSDLTTAANARDADGVRRSAQAVIDRLDAAQRDGLTPEQAAVVRDRAQLLLTAADSIDADLIAEREAAEAERLEQERLEAERAQAEREAAEQAAEEQQRLEEEQKAAEEAAKAAEKAAEEARKAEEEAAEEEDEAQPTPSATPEVVPTPTATPTP